MLRLDPDPLAQHGSDIQMIVLTLYGCQLTQHAFDVLSDGVGKSFEYNINQEAQVSVFQFFINYWADEVEVQCQRWNETRVECTSADLLARSKHLAARYTASLKQYAQLEQHYDALTKLFDELKKDITQQQERLHKKLHFFAGTHPAKAETVKSNIKIYQRLAYLLEDAASGQENL